tara:strand:+ start:656 stop:925 length:270 start_codon:yes stop_codon:yes gene_type:complete
VGWVQALIASFLIYFFYADIAKSLPNLLVSSLAAVTLIDNLTRCEPATSANNLFDYKLHLISALNSAVSYLFSDQVIDVVFVCHGDILL